MLIGVLWFALGLVQVPEIKEADKITPARPGDVKMSRLFTVLFLPDFAAAILGWFISGTMFGAVSTDAFIFFCFPVILFFFTTWKIADEKTEREPIAALLAVFGVVSFSGLFFIKMVLH